MPNFNFNAALAWRLGYLVVFAGCLGMPGCSGPKPATVTLVRQGEQFADLPEAQIADLEGPIREFCADCHVYPDPSSYPKGNWSEEVARGFEFYVKSGRTDLEPPDQAAVTEYFQTLAPDKLDVTAPSEDVSGPVLFRSTLIERTGPVKNPGASHVLFSDAGMFLCDAITNEVGRVQLGEGSEVFKPLFDAEAPAHVALFDPFSESTDGNHLGLLVAELGTFTPEDHAKGMVRFIPYDPKSPGDATGAPVTLLAGVGRVADVTVADLNQDGKLDIAVAEFGWHDTGGMHVLLNNCEKETVVFEHRKLDAGHGPSHVHIFDVDQDGDKDLVVLRSQEYEAVEVYLNDGEANFAAPDKVFNAPVPDYGFSSMDVADIDGDGDTDLVLSNGDSLDSFLLKPHHSIQWLENKSTQGEVTFQHHHVAKLPAAYGATAGDIDGDGDVDLVGCAMAWQSGELNSVVWYEQGPGLTFTPHCIDLSFDQHATVEVGDFDADGDLDIAVGELDRFAKLEFCGTIWWNDGPR